MVCKITEPSTFRYLLMQVCVRTVIRLHLNFLLYKLNTSSDSTETQVLEGYSAISFVGLFDIAPAIALVQRLF